MILKQCDLEQVDATSPASAFDRDSTDWPLSLLKARRLDLGTMERVEELLK